MQASLLVFALHNSNLGRYQGLEMKVGTTTMKPGKKPKAGAKSKPPLRVRHEPPTLDEAIFAAQGLSDKLSEQIEIAASLMGLSVEEVGPRVRAQASPRGSVRQLVLRGAAGTERRVVVERKTPRRFQPPLRPADFRS
jgi:hypothetical protein